MEKKFNEIVFKTGGTTSDGKGVVKTFENLKRECLDINEELKFENGLKFITTTTDEHLFGFTFSECFLMFAGLIGMRQE